MRDRRFIFAFPTNDELFAVFVAWPIDELGAVRNSVEDELANALDGVPDLAERVRAGKRERRGRITRGTSTWRAASQFRRRCSSPARKSEVTLRRRRRTS
jgi:hypothetical protein